MMNYCNDDRRKIRLKTTNVRVTRRNMGKKFSAERRRTFRVDGLILFVSFYPMPFDRPNRFFDDFPKFGAAVVFEKLASDGQNNNLNNDE